jgi:hypothetical protein
MYINSISADKIDLLFEFTRPNGEIITGHYKGTCSNISTVD